MSNSPNIMPRAPHPLSGCATSPWPASTLSRNKPARTKQTAGKGAIGTDGYNRTRHLPRLIPLWPGELADDTAAGAERIVMLLRKALRAERNRGRGGHWSYDLNRHLALLEAYKAESARLGSE